MTLCISKMPLLIFLLLVFRSVINVYDILNAKKFVVDQAALAKIEEVFA